MKARDPKNRNFIFGVSPKDLICPQEPEDWQEERQQAYRRRHKRSEKETLRSPKRQQVI
jgi:hypothetical protein